MTSDTTPTTNQPGPASRRSKISRRLIGAGVVVAVLAVGAVAGAAVSRHIQHGRPFAVLLMQPGPIAAMAPFSPVAIKGQVAEIFGNKFIVQDDSGRTLVDTGPRGESAKPVTKGETVTVQGRFDNGVIHAAVMIRADGSSEAFGPPGPRFGRHPDDRSGPGGERGPGHGPARGPGPDHEPPPPPPSAL